MRIPRLLAAAAVALLGACGGPGPGPAPEPSGYAGPDAASVYLQVSQCFRAHGHPDFPDPVQAGDGGWEFPVTADRVPVPDECAGLVRQAKALAPPGAGDPTATVDLQGRRAFARCMREHGVADWPDPGPDGTFTVPARLADPGAERQWTQTAGGACGHLQPPGGPDVILATPR